MKVNFNNVTMIVDNLKKESIAVIKDGIVYSNYKDGSYPTVNYKGFSICKFKNGRYDISSHASACFAKLSSLKKCIAHIDNMGKCSINIIDLIS